MFYNIPTATKLTAMFGLDPDAAFRAFRAWHATLDPTKTVDERVSAGGEGVLLPANLLVSAFRRSERTLSSSSSSSRVHHSPLQWSGGSLAIRFSTRARRKSTVCAIRFQAAVCVSRSWLAVTYMGSHRVRLP